jgi:DnaJ family protein C protein 19
LFARCEGCGGNYWELEKMPACRESAAADKIQKAHRTIMMANHPDSGGSPLIATKVNEAKEVLIGKKKATGSPFS